MLLLGASQLGKIYFSEKYAVLVLFCSSKFVLLGSTYFSENQCELCYTLSPFRPPRMPPLSWGAGRRGAAGAGNEGNNSQFHEKEV